jgi:hypothetical protein
MLYRRVEACIESRGGHFEHFIINDPFQIIIIIIILIVWCLSLQ